MKTRSVRKRREALYVEQLLKLLKLDSRIVDDTGEAPDLLIEVDGAVVGIEVTEVFQNHRGDGMSPQAREAFARQVLAKAKQKYRDSSGAPASVSVHFSLNQDLRRIQRDSLATQLADFVKSLSVEPGELKQWRPSYMNDSLPEAVTFVQAYGLPTNSMVHHWKAPSAGWVAALSCEVLQSRVDEKARLLAKYRDKVRENWLLLVSDGANPSQFFDTPTEGVARAIRSPFERTFYLASIKGLAVELGVLPHVAAPES